MRNTMLNGSIYTMIATIDKAGRLVIPKPLRDAMGLKPGVPLDVTFVDGRIEIEYAPVEAWVRIAEDGFPIIETADDTPIDFDTREVREEMYREREERWL